MCEPCRCQEDAPWREKADESFVAVRLGPSPHEAGLITGERDYHGRPGQNVAMIRVGPSSCRDMFHRTTVRSTSRRKHP